MTPQTLYHFIKRTRYFTRIMTLRSMIVCISYVKPSSSELIVDMNKNKPPIKFKFTRIKWLWPGGGGTPLYGLYRSVCGPKGYGFFSRFGYKYGIDYSHFAATVVINRVPIFAL